MNMKTFVKLVTPEWAKLILDQYNPHNRNLSQNTVLSYAIDMEQGRWTLTHQGIALDDAGNLIDGQHRLAAIVLAGVSIEMLVTTGIPATEKRNGVVIHATDNVDRLRVRNVGQQLCLSHGLKSGVHLAAAATAVVQLATGHRWRMSAGSTLGILQLFGTPIQGVLDLLDTKHRLKDVTGPAALFFALDAAKTTDFLNQWQTLDNLAGPARVLIQWQTRHGQKQDNLNPMRVCCSCLYAHFRNRDIKKMYPNEEGRNWIIEQHKANLTKVRKLVGDLTHAQLNQANL